MRCRCLRLKSGLWLGLILINLASGELLFRATFDEGLTAEDSRGEGVPLVDQGVRRVPAGGGRDGQAVAIEGAARLVYAAPGNMNPRQGKVLVWVKPSWDAPAGNYVINLFGQRGSGQFILFFYQDGRLILRVYDAEGNRGNLTSEMKIADGDWRDIWHEVGFAYDLDTATAQLLVDGRVERVGHLPQMPDLSGKLKTIGIGHYVGNEEGQLNGLIDDVRIFSKAEIAAAQHEETAAKAMTVTGEDDSEGTQRTEPPNGGFESGLEHWRIQPAEDYSQIEVVPEPLAAEGRHVLHIEHQRTRSCSIDQRVSLKPYSSYLLQADVRGRRYTRSRMGLFLRVFCDGLSAGMRYSESDITSSWDTKRFPVVTGETGMATVLIELQHVAGDIWIDNIRINECPRAELKRILGPGYPSSIPKIPLRPNQVESRVWYNEVPVSRTVPSRVTFQIRHSLEEGVWESSGRFHLQLPDSVRLLGPEGVQRDDGAGAHYVVDGDDIVKIGREYWCRIDLLASGEVQGGATARFWAETDRGREQARSAPVRLIEVPVVQQPRRIITGTTSYEHVPPLYDDYAALVKQLGFNRINFWKVGQGAEYIQPLRQAGVEVDTEWSGMGDVRQEAADIEEAHSISFTGRKYPHVIDASHRGKLYDLAKGQVRGFAHTGFSGIIVDDEHYNDWNGMDTCVCDRCEEAWREWMAEHRPGVAALSPSTVLDDPLNHPIQYRAWWLFRASLVTEWYRGIREAFLEAVASSGARSTDTPYMTLQVSHPGYDHIKSSFKNPVELQSLFELIMPQFYADGLGVHHLTRELVKEVGPDQACPTLCMGTARSLRFEWEPGQLPAQILEALFAGACGYTTWSWPYSNLRIIAEVAQTNGIIADYESVLREGVASRRFWTEDARCTCSVLETDEDVLMLVGNYRRNDNDRVVIRCQPASEERWREVFSGQILELSPEQLEASLTVMPGRATLWHLERD